MDFITDLLAICGAVSVVGGAGAVIFKVIRPAFKLSKRINTVERHQDSDLRRLKAIEDMQKQQSKALAALLNHQIDGNGIERMKEIRDELLEAVIER